jgi:hypothetical protein
MVGNNALTIILAMAAEVNPLMQVFLVRVQDVLLTFCTF